MELLFLLLFNSATGVFSDDYSVREDTVQRLRVLQQIATPSLLLATDSGDPEAVNRCWPLLSSFRYQQRLTAAVDILDNGWPLSSVEAQRLYYDFNLWKAVFTVVTERSTDEQKLAVTNLWPTLDPDSHSWRYDTNSWTDLQKLVNEAKIEHGAGIHWLFR